MPSSGAQGSTLERESDQQVGGSEEQAELVPTHAQIRIHSLSSLSFPPLPWSQLLLSHLPRLSWFNDPETETVSRPVRFMLEVWTKTPVSGSPVWCLFLLGSSAPYLSPILILLSACYVSWYRESTGMNGTDNGFPV